MNILRNRKVWLVACGLWLVACGFVTGNKAMSQGESLEETSKHMPCMQISSCIAGIKSLFIRQIIAQKNSDQISYNELTEYDLNTVEIQKQIARTMLLAEDLTYNGKFIFTVANNVEGFGTEKPELLAVITEIKPELCRGVIKKNKGIRRVGVEVDIPVSKKPNLLPYPTIIEDQKVVTLPPTSSGMNCIQANGEFYYYQVIYEF